MKPGADDISTRETAVGVVLGPEQVHEAMRELVGVEGTETARREDAAGVYLVEWTVAGETAGERAEYSYRRMGTFKEYAAAATVIDVVFYDADGIPVGGRVLAEWTNGRWKRQ